MRARPTLCWICGLLALLLAATASAVEDLVASNIGVYDGPMLDPGHARLTTVLARVVKPDGVDYAALRREPRELDLYLEQLALATVPEAREARMALFINAYNAWTLALVARNLPEDRAAWPRWSIKQLGSFTKNPWKRWRFEFGDATYTLDQVEHEILRPMGDPRIHMAINCASRSCPPLRTEAYVAARLDAQLEAAARDFCASPYHVRVQEDTRSRDQPSLLVNPILDWFADDFTAGGGVRAFLAARAEGEAKRWLVDPGITISFFDYDWTLNLAKDG